MVNSIFKKLGEKMVKKYIASALVGLGITQMNFQSIQLVANEDSSEFPCCEATIVADRPLDPCLINAGYPYPATISLCNGWDIYAKGDFLYFSCSVDLESPIAQETTLSGLQTSNLFISTSYRPGFGISVGFNLGSVVFDTTYLRYHARNTSRFTARDDSGITMVTAAGSVLNQNPVVFSTIRTTRHFDLDSILFSLQKPVYMGKKIIMNLNYGLLALWAGQKWDVNGIALNAPPVNVVTSSGFIEADHRIWAVGPNLGFNAKALLPMSLRAIAGINLAIQYAAVYKGFTTTSFPTALDPLTGTLLVVDNTSVKIKGNAPCLQAYHSGQIGIGWGDYLACDKYHIDLSLTYNFIFLHMFDFGMPLSNTAMDVMAIASSSIHGIAIGGRLDF